MVRLHLDRLCHTLSSYSAHNHLCPHSYQPIEVRRETKVDKGQVLCFLRRFQNHPPLNQVPIDLLLRKGSIHLYVRISFQHTNSVIDYHLRASAFRSLFLGKRPSLQDQIRQQC